MLGALRQRAAETAPSAAGADVLLRLSALLVLIVGTASGVFSALMLIPAVLIVASPSHLRSAPVWWSLCALLAVGHLWRWYDIANHRWLMLAWTMACAWSVSRGDVMRVLRVNARLMIAIAFMAGAIQKLVFGGWYDGLYLELYAHHQPWFATALGVGDSQVHSGLSLLRWGVIDELVLPLSEVGRSRLPLIAVSWAVIVGELAIGCLFMAKPGPRVVTWRTWSLLAFAWIAYPLAPVRGFGWLLLIMTAATLPPESGHLRRACWVSLVWITLCPFVYRAGAYMARLADVWSG
jgi:hypothetical protein